MKLRSLSTGITKLAPWAGIRRYSETPEQALLSWFEVIQTVDEGNGQVGRMISDHARSQSLGYPASACLAAAIERGKKPYYPQLEKAGLGMMGVNVWLDYFADTIIKAQEIVR